MTGEDERASQASLLLDGHCIHDTYPLVYQEIKKKLMYLSAVEQFSPTGNHLSLSWSWTTQDKH